MLPGNRVIILYQVMLFIKYLTTEFPHYKQKMWEENIANFLLSHWVNIWSYGEPPASACAHTLLSTEMALREGALCLKLLFRSRNFYKFTPLLGGVRSLAEKVSTKQVTSSVPETASDHVIYTQEHFALKESLRKVRLLTVTLSSKFWDDNKENQACF